MLGWKPDSDQKNKNVADTEPNSNCAIEEITGKHKINILSTYHILTTAKGGIYQNKCLYFSLATPLEILKGHIFERHPVNPPGYPALDVSRTVS